MVTEEARQVRLHVRDGDMVVHACTIISLASSGSPS